MHTPHTRARGAREQAGVSTDGLVADPALETVFRASTVMCCRLVEMQACTNVVEGGAGRHRQDQNMLMHGGCEEHLPCARNAALCSAFLLVVLVMVSQRGHNVLHWS